MGFPYASFLLGLVNSGTVNPPADLRTGKHFISLFAQDSWKITRKLTFNYGLRYDYDTAPQEQYGRLPTLSPTLANPTAGGHPGGAIYESTCNCSFAKNYPYGFGPRLGVAYQITPKTVFRAGIGIAYDGTATCGHRNWQFVARQQLQCAWIWGARYDPGPGACPRHTCCRGPTCPPVRTPIPTSRQR